MQYYHFIHKLRSYKIMGSKKGELGNYREQDHFEAFLPIKTKYYRNYNLQAYENQQYVK